MKLPDHKFFRRQRRISYRGHSTRPISKCDRRLGTNADTLCEIRSYVWGAHTSGSGVIRDRTPTGGFAECVYLQSVPVIKPEVLTLRHQTIANWVSIGQRCAGGSPGSADWNHQLLLRSWQT